MHLGDERTYSVVPAPRLCAAGQYKDHADRRWPGCFRFVFCIGAASLSWVGFAHLWHVLLTR